MPEPRPLLTPAKDFEDVSRGDPIPHKLKGEALVAARLTTDTWRLEITADEKVTLTKPLKIADSNAIDLPMLLELGKTRGVRFLKAMQCNNIARPLGQGLWEGVPLRDVLAMAGTYDNVRRLYYWGFHNNDPKQIFRSSLAINQVLDSPPGDLPPFIAYRLNGDPISLERGGPVRLVVPWAHGFKSVKWLQGIVLTNNFLNNDTYAERNNDPESYLKTAAYFDLPAPENFAVGKPIAIRGTAMVGWPGLKRVEAWLRPDAGTHGKIADDDSAWATARWQPCVIDAPPANWGLPEGVTAKDIHGFDATGKPLEWPLRYSFGLWNLTLTDLKAGAYELRVRTVDRNDMAQPLPRPYPKSGRNAVQCKQFVVQA